jgi:hypothetical protein
VFEAWRRKERKLRAAAEKKKNYGKSLLGLWFMVSDSKQSTKNIRLHLALTHNTASFSDTMIKYHGFFYMQLVMLLYIYY